METKDSDRSQQPSHSAKHKYGAICVPQELRALFSELVEYHGVTRGDLLRAMIATWGFQRLPVQVRLLAKPPEELMNGPIAKARARRTGDPDKARAVRVLQLQRKKLASEKNKPEYQAAHAEINELLQSDHVYNGHFPDTGSWSKNRFRWYGFRCD